MCDKLKSSPPNTDLHCTLYNSTQSPFYHAWYTQHIFSVVLFFSPVSYTFIRKITFCKSWYHVVWCMPPRVPHILKNRHSSKKTKGEEFHRFITISSIRYEGIQKFLCSLWYYLCILFFLIKYNVAMFLLFYHNHRLLYFLSYKSDCPLIITVIGGNHSDSFDVRHFQDSYWSWMLA